MSHPEFEVHILNEQGIANAKRLAEVFDGALTEIETLVPFGYSRVPFTSSDGQPKPQSNGRELALVRTHLEIASFYAKKALAIHAENQK